MINKKIILGFAALIVVLMMYKLGEAAGDFSIILRTDKKIYAFQITPYSIHNPFRET